MKKTLLTIFAAVFTIGYASAQCTPNPALAGEDFGLWPDTIPFVQACVGCGDASRVVDLVTLVDTTMVVGPAAATIYFDVFKIMEVTGMPAGLTYGTDVEGNATAEAPFGEWYNTGAAPNIQNSQGCVYINGAEADWIPHIGGGPNSDGIFPLVIMVDVRIESTDPDLSFVGVNAGDWLSAVPPGVGGGLIPVEDYFLDVRQGYVGINDIDPNRLGILDNYPNPVEDVTTIKFNSPHSVKNLSFSVYSIIGNEVHGRQISAATGINTFTFDATDLTSGMYLYTISDGQSSVTRKMTVK